MVTRRNKNKKTITNKMEKVKRREIKKCVVLGAQEIRNVLFLLKLLLLFTIEKLIFRFQKM